MKTLSNHVILYDQECPLCNAYTNAFIKTGMLDKNGREPFEQINPVYIPWINTERACDEIALVDVPNQTVVYGIDSLFKILGNRFALFKPLFALSGFRWLMTKLYFFISYNRKVIAPSKNFMLSGSCTPTFNLTYRWTYLIFTWILTSFVLTTYAFYLSPLIPESSLGREFLICGGQILFQGVVVWMINPARVIHYLGNMMTVSLIGALLLLPLIVLGSMGLMHSPYLFAGWFMIVVACMLYEHSRRSSILSLPLLVSFAWVLYRLIILTLIFSL